MKGRLEEYFKDVVYEQFFRYIHDIDYMLCFFAPDSLVGNCFKHKSIFHGVNFPADGPVMKKETTGWDPSFEKMTVCNGSLRGDVTMFLLLKNGGYHRCHFNTTYK